MPSLADEMDVGGAGAASFADILTGCVQGGLLLERCLCVGGVHALVVVVQLKAACLRALISLSGFDLFFFEAELLLRVDPVFAVPVPWRSLH